MLASDPSSSGEKTGQDTQGLSRVAIAPNALPRVADFVRNRWQLSRGISGRLAVESVAALLWNQWQGSTGIRNIWLLSRQFDFAGETMALAMKRTFATRGTTISGEPIALAGDFAKEPARQIQWQGFVRKNRLQNVPASFAEIVAVIAVFLGPIARALAFGEEFQGSWKAPGPWD